MSSRSTKSNQRSRPRPDVYTQALNAAKKRLEAALSEKEIHKTALSGLNEEIPRLRKIIEAFELTKAGVELPPVKVPKVEGVRSTQDFPVQERPGIRPNGTALQQVPDHLKRFMTQNSEEIKGTSENDPDDRFLPDVE